MDMIKFCNVSKKFGKVLVVDNFSLQIEKGEFVGILGPSGCGKTTLLRMIAGLEIPDAGTIEIGGKVANNPQSLIPPRERKVGMVFQDLALWPHMSAVAHLDFVLRSQPQVKSEKFLPDGEAGKVKSLNERIKEIFAIVKFPLELSEKYPHQLSGGEKQRLAIARALAQEPHILLLDEPFANLDAMLKYDLETEIKRLHQTLNTTLLYVTHDAKEVKTVAKRLVVMDKGTIVQEGSVEELFTHPKSEFVDRLMGEK